MDLKDKVVVITGSSKGLGKEIARVFHEREATVIVSSREDNELKKTVDELNALPIVADVSKRQDIETLAQSVINKYGRIDFWINNAGIWLPHASIEETDWGRVHELIEVNLFGTVYGSRAALIQMKKQRSGTIVNILSTSALEGRSGSSGYSASKWAAAGFTKSLRAEVKDAGIKVISVYPGGMQTNFFDEKKPDNINDYMPVSFVASKIVDNLIKDDLEEELIIRRPAN